MNLEFFEDGLDGGPMILLYGGGPHQVADLRNAIRTLAERVGHQIDLSELPFVQSIDKCRLRAISAAADLGVATRAPADFTWTLGQESWSQVHDLLEPFGREPAGVSFQYLNPSSGPEIMYSTARAW